MDNTTNHFLFPIFSASPTFLLIDNGTVDASSRMLPKPQAKIDAPAAEK
jgi:hypothetical protein